MSQEAWDSEEGEDEGGEEVATGGRGKGEGIGTGRGTSLSAAANSSFC